MRLMHGGEEGGPGRPWAPEAGGLPAPPRPEGDAAPLEARYRHFSEHAQDVVCRILPDGSVAYVSPVVRALLGYEPADLVGRRVCDLLHPEDAPQALRERDAFLAGGGASAATLRVRRKDGSHVWVEVRASPVRDAETGALVELLCAARDVTARRLGELAVAESERRFRATFEQAAVGVGHHAPDGRWLRVNERLCALAGRSREEMLARDVLGLTHPDDRPGLEAALARLLRGEQEVHQAEQRLVRPDGSSAWVNLTASLVRREGGEPEYVLAVIEDITPRKRSEQDLEMARRELAHMEKLSALGTLVGGVAHELRTPLAYATNHLHWIQRRVQAAAKRPPTPEDLRQMERSVQDALDGLERIGRLVQDLRRFASRDRGQRASARLHEVVKEALDLFRATHRGTHSVEARLDPVPAMALDRVQVQQVVLNLLENAADAMPHGGPIGIATRVLDGEAEVAVSDRGGGIPPDAQARLFDPFYTTKAHGMGLGLSIVKRLVEAHGGRIRLETEAGEGTTFHVAFPLTGEGLPAPGAPQA